MSPVWRILIAGAALTLVLAAMIGERLWHLQTGTEVTLAAEPVDPRDLFRGDYVTLSYGFTRFEAPAQPDGQSERDVWVRLTRDGALWRHSEIAFSPLSARSPDEVILRGRAIESGGVWNDGDARMNYRTIFGIESYFVPEGQGRPIEQAIGAGRIEIVLAVTPDGEAAIKALRLDGVELYREGLF